MNESLLRYKFKASGIHFSISSAIFAVILYFILVYWYPFPYFVTDGGWQGVRLMIAVDLVLGPFLTFLVFDYKKKRREIVFDLSVIATVQLTALVWGGLAVYSQRPAVIVQMDEVFRSVTAKPYEDQGVELSQISAMSPQHPPVVYSLPPQTREDYLAQRKRILKGIGINAQVEIYRPLADYLSQVFEFRLDMQAELAEHEDLKIELEEFLRKQEAKLDDFYFMPYLGRYTMAILVFDKKGIMRGALHSQYSMYRITPDSEKPDSNEKKKK